jgi:ferric-dicitrate binding protein FerR (iron transport regulator)
LFIMIKDVHKSTKDPFLRQKMQRRERMFMKTKEKNEAVEEAKPISSDTPSAEEAPKQEEAPKTEEAPKKKRRRRQITALPMCGCGMIAAMKAAGAPWWSPGRGICFVSPGGTS